MILLSVVLLFTIAGFLLLIDHKDKRAHAEREAHRKELQLVLNRIQDPTVAVQQTQDFKPASSHHLPYEDDKAWAQWMETN